MSDQTRIISTNIEEQMKTAYIDYSMSVIVSRALPDVRDGLKPVHRRVLYGMRKTGITPTGSYKKSARVVGEVLGKYHPHGDSSVYDTMVRMAQEWSLRYPLVDGQGNFGSVDGDSPAAMRYTEVRFQRLSMEMLRDLDKDTVDFQNNFDDTEREPVVLPAYIPSLLVNGSSGIAVGMATNMPPHNLTEVINGTIAYINDREIELEGLMEHITGPDFPTGGTIYGTAGIRDAYATGKGRVVMRGKYHLEEHKDREQIVFTEIPYQVNKAEMIKKIADLVNHKTLEGISAIRDESDRKGMRIVFQLKQDALPDIVVNSLFKMSALQSSFSINNIALVNGKPETLGIKTIIKHFVDHRHDVLVRRTQFDLKKAEDEAHILEGLLIALDHLDEVIKLIRGSQTAEIAREGLISNFKLSERQAKAILDLRLQKLTGLERDKIKSDFEALQKLIAELTEILGSEVMRMDIIKQELEEIKQTHGDERRTNILQSTAEVSIEDLIPDHEVVVTISKAGYIKRTPLSEYRAQSRGGVGSKGASTRNDDVLEHIFISSNHSYILLFTEKGKCFWKKTYEIPEGSKAAKGRAIQNLLQIDKDDKVLAFIHTKNLNDKDYTDQHYIIMATKNGIIKKSSLTDYSRPRQRGINAITIKEDDRLLAATMTNGQHEIMLAANGGKAVRFNEEQIRATGRTSSGVMGIRLESDDFVVGMITFSPEEQETHTVFVMSEKGYGKRSALDNYRITKRGAKGVRTINITDKTGKLFGLLKVNEENDIIIITEKGITLRTASDELRVIGKATQGVKLINLKGKDKVASLTAVNKEEEQEDLDQSDDTQDES